MKYVLTIKNVAFELVQDPKTQIFSWVPVNGGAALGLFNTENRALFFAKDRVRQLGKSASLVERNESETN